MVLRKQLATAEVEVKRHEKDMKRQKWLVDNPENTAEFSTNRYIVKEAEKAYDIFGEDDQLMIRLEGMEDLKSRARKLWKDTKGANWDSKDWKQVVEKFRIDYKTLSSDVKKKKAG